MGQEGPSTLETPPGAEPVEATLRATLAAALADQDPSYVPRTRHLRPDGRPRFVNRLLLETSPYLRQHAHNPVDWRPWGDEAFAEAARRGVPVLLSVGYATCHWCHVMEEESFEDEEIAGFLNAHYVAVKVDREERPDVDSVYMACVQAWSGQGGWPMTVVLAPDRRPFFGGTYFPARDGDRGAHTGFLTLLGELSRVYQEQPERASAAAADVVRAVQGRLAGAAAAGGLPDDGPLHRAYSYYDNGFDPEWGGLGHAPKFPSSLPVRFLLRYARRFGKDALAMATLTLDRMARGGMHDQVGGGFHRYSVDAEWLVPHFEKMLYDNALLAVAYVEAWQLTGRQDFADVAKATLDYVLREMTAPHGGFYSATDADSPNPDRGGEREEGCFFTWTPAELAGVLGPETARIVGLYYGVSPRGNFEGRSILHLPRTPADVATELGLTTEALAAIIATAKTALYEARRHRAPPLLDDKALAGWNGLMISALARAAQALGAPRFLTAAVRAAHFVEASLTEGGRLRRSYRGGTGAVPAFLEDYAYVIQGYLDLYEAGFDLTWLAAAIRLADDAEVRFADREAGGYFATADDHEALLVREKPGYDGATPSGNSVMALATLRLAALTGAPRWRQRAERTLKAFHKTLSEAPAALAEMLLAVDFLRDGPRQIVLVAPQHVGETAPFLTHLARTFQPNRVVAAAAEADLTRAQALIPLFHDKRALGGRPTAFICDDTVCQAPVQDEAAFAHQLRLGKP